MSLVQMKQIVREQLATIDEVLAHRGTQVNFRPLEAAIFFVEECIVGIHGGIKDDFAEKPWFADIYKWTYGWYRERYGDALDVQQPGFLTGIVRVYGTPFALRVPTTITMDEEPGERVWLIFPDTLMPEENPTDWIHPKPKLDHLTPEDTATLNNEIEFVTDAVRAIDRGISTADCAQPAQKMLGGSVAGHIDSAVQYILSGKPEQVSVGFWEMNLSIEKLMKLFLSQKGTVPPKTHNLTALRKLADQFSASAVLESDFRTLPSGSEAISYRYGEATNVTVSKAIDTYFSVLRIAAFYSAALDRRIIMNNARFLLQKPPWAR